MDSSFEDGSPSDQFVQDTDLFWEVDIVRVDILGRNHFVDLVDLSFVESLGATNTHKQRS